MCHACIHSNDIKKVKDDAESIWRTMNDDNIELNLRFSIINLMMITAGIILTVCSLKLLCRARKACALKKELSRVKRESAKS